jgi:integrase
VTLTQTFEIKAEANAWLDRTRAELKLGMGEATPDVTMTVEQAAMRWLQMVEVDGEGKRGAVSSNTLKSYREIVKNQVLARIDGVPDLASLPVHRLTPDLVEDWSMKLSLAVGRDMAKRALRILKAVLDLAVRAKAVPSNAGLSVKLANESKRREEDGRAEIILQKEDMDEIERIAGEWAEHGYDRLKEPMPSAKIIAGRRAAWPRYQAVISDMRHTGKRIGESMALRWRDVDLENGFQNIAHSITVEIGVDEVSGRSGSKVGPPKTHAGRREVAMGAPAIVTLKRWYGVQRAQHPGYIHSQVIDLKAELGSNSAVARALGISETAVRKRLARAASSTGDQPRHGPDSFVFGTDAGRTWMLPENFRSDAWRPLMIAAGLRDKDGDLPVPHDGRHFFASRAIAAGVPIEVLSEGLGHESIDVTLKIYGHLQGNKRAKAKAAAALMDAFDGA